MSAAIQRLRVAGPVAAALLAIAGDASGQVRGDDPPDQVVEAAREHFQRGVELTAAGKLKEALDEFQAAYDLSPTYRILYNIAQVSRHVGDEPRSLRAFERYLADGGDEIERTIPGRRAEVEAEIASLRSRVGTLRVRVEPEGATVSLDGTPAGEAPLDAPLYVRPGVHRLRAERAGRVPASQEVDVAAGASVEVTLRLQAPVGDRKTVVPPSRGRAPTWIGWVATGALAAGAGVTGVLALVSDSELEDARYAGPGTTPPPDSDVTSLQGQVEALAIVTDVLAGAAAVSFGVTLYFTLTEPPAAQPPPRAARGAALRMRMSGRGVSLGGTF